MFGWTPLQQAVIAKRNAIIVHLVEGGTTRKEVAQRLGVSVATVAAVMQQRKRLQTARRLRAIDEGDNV
jgi:DNA-binding NarL/FixJ family response regulator